MSDAYLIPCFIDNSPKKSVMVFNDSFEYANGPSANPYVGSSIKCSFKASVVTVRFSTIYDNSNRWNSQSNVSINTDYQIAPGNSLTLKTWSRTQGSTYYTLYYQVYFSSDGMTLRYQVSYNQYNEWFTATTTGMATFESF